MTGQIVAARPEHAHRMAPRMRAAEVMEIRASHDMEPATMLLSEVEKSSIAWAWVVGDEVGCMFGIVDAGSFLSQESYPWMLTTDLVEKHWRFFARSCRELLPEVLSRHSRLSGMVDARYALSVRWLSWMGARIEVARPWGPAGVPFHPFTLGG